jgi:hypothetical protein
VTGIAGASDPGTEIVAELLMGVHRRLVRNGELAIPGWNLSKWRASRYP